MKLWCNSYKSLLHIQVRLFPIFVLRVQDFFFVRKDTNTQHRASTLMIRIAVLTRQDLQTEGKKIRRQPIFSTGFFFHVVQPRHLLDPQSHFLMSLGRLFYYSDRQGVSTLMKFHVLYFHKIVIVMKRFLVCFFPFFFLYTRSRPMCTQGKAFSLSDQGLRPYCIVHIIAQSQSCFCYACSIVATISLGVIYNHVRVLA